MLHFQTTVVPLRVSDVWNKANFLGVGYSAVINFPNLNVFRALAPAKSSPYSQLGIPADGNYFAWRAWGTLRIVTDGSYTVGFPPPHPPVSPVACA